MTPSPDIHSQYASWVIEQKPSTLVRSRTSILNGTIAKKHFPKEDLSLEANFGFTNLFVEGQWKDQIMKID
jgi:hypothetical protein